MSPAASSTRRAVSRGEYGIPIVNRRIAVSPIANVAAGHPPEALVALAHTLDDVAGEVGVDLIGGFGAHVQKATTAAADALIDALPEALSTTSRVCGYLEVASTRTGINMDAVNRIARTILDIAHRDADNAGFAAAKLVVFANLPDDNPFMAGATHGARRGGLDDQHRRVRPGRRAARARAAARGRRRALAPDADRRRRGDQADRVPRDARRRADGPRARRLPRRRLRHRRSLSLAPTPRRRRLGRRDPPGHGHRARRRARLDGGHRDAERRGQEGRRVRELERRRAVGRVHPGHGGRDARRRGRGGLADEREARGDDQRLQRRARHAAGRGARRRRRRSPGSSPTRWRSA